MAFFFVLFAIFFYPSKCDEDNTFLHLKGSLETLLPSFGQRTAYSDSSHPAGRQSYCLAYREIEGEKSIWLLGGHGYYSTGYSQKLNDVWEYSIQKNQWRYWTGNEDGGEQIVFDQDDFHLANNPGSWSHMACWMHEQKDQLFLTLGKICENYTNEMWVWDFKKRLYKQLTKKKVSNFGTTGQFCNECVPPPLISWNSFAVFAENSSFIFGGWNRDENDPFQSNLGYSNDLWEYSHDVNQWRHVKGPSNETEEIDGKTKYHSSGYGIFDAENYPARRTSHCMWYTSNRIWVFGGGLNDPDLKYFNDLWAFDLDLRMWGLIRGDPEGGFSTGICRIEYEYDNENDPPTGAGNAAFVIGELLMLYGGHNYDMYNDYQLDYSSLWVYSVDKNQWKFARGTLGEQVPLNYEENEPGSRDNGHFVGSATNQNASYFFGGCCYNQTNLHQDLYCNDVWIYSGYECFGYDKTDPFVCSGKGECVFANVCECSGLARGYMCQLNNAGEVVLIVIGVLFGSVGIAVLASVVIALIAFIVVTLVNQKKQLKKYDAIGGKILLDEYAAENRQSKAKISVNMKLFQISWENIEILKQIGEGGSNSRIYLAKWNNVECCFKMFQTNHMWSNQDRFSEFEKEISIVSSIHHPNIINVYGASIKHPRVGIVQEYAENGTLNEYVSKRKGTIEINSKIKWFKEMALALDYLHSRKIIHRDLKSPNVLLDSSLKIKLIDFGLSKYEYDSKKGHTVRVGTAWYMAPEVVLSGDYNEMIDIFSLSIIMFEVLEENFFPYGKGSSSGVEIKVAKDPNFRPRFQKTFPQYLMDLIKKCWDSDPNNRLKAKKVFELLDSKSK